MLQRDRRRQALYLADLRVDGRANEAACEGGYRFKVATLAFAVNRAESKRRLARAGHPSDSDEFATGHIDVDVAQVVQVGIADLDSRHVL